MIQFSKAKLENFISQFLGFSTDHRKMIASIENLRPGKEAMESVKSLY